MLWILSRCLALRLSYLQMESVTGGVQVGNARNRSGKGLRMAETAGPYSREQQARVVSPCGACGAAGAAHISESRPLLEKQVGKRGPDPFKRMGDTRSHLRQFTWRPENSATLMEHAARIPVHWPIGDPTNFGVTHARVRWVSSARGPLHHVVVTRHFGSRLELHAVENRTVCGAD